MKKKFWRFGGREENYINNILKFGLKHPKNLFNQRLEKRWSEFHNLNYSITINSCTSALHVACLSLGIKKYDEVLVPVLTPIMCGTSIHLAGGTPVYVDVDNDSFLLDLKDLERKITKNTKAILAVHMYSGICNLKKIKNICKKYNLFLIEDCAEAVGARDENNFLVGTKGDISCWSFQYAKQLTCGDGGILSTNNKFIAEKIRKNSNLGFKSLTATGDRLSLTREQRQNPNYERFDTIGFNYRMNQFSAAIALAQFEKIDFFINLRRMMGLEFEKALKNNRFFKSQKIHNNAFSTYYTFAACLKDKTKIKWKNFRKKFIESGGDPIYAANKIISQEPAIKNNLIGHCFKSCKKNCVRSCKGTPNANRLQKKLFLFTTNQKNIKEIKKQKNALLKTINYFKLQNNLNIGIFQGRLTTTSEKILQKFPKDWEREFFYLKKLNYDYLELFLEEKINYNNPFWNHYGRVKIKKHLNNLKFNKLILCDNFCLHNTLDKENTVLYLVKIIKILSNFKNKKLIIPLTNIQNIKNKNQALININTLTNTAFKEKVEISFESEGFPNYLINFIEKRIKNNVGITFDVGNVYLKNKNINLEFEKYNKFINHIHIKDRDKFNKNVVLGKGLINFQSFFNKIRKLNYNGEITLETHRGDNAISTAIENKNFIDRLI